ncbi:MAG: S8 family serine peptidase [Anaerolineae bacterium]
MHRSRPLRVPLLVSLALTLVLLAISAASALPPAAAAQGPQLPSISLKSRTIKPTAGVDAATSAQLQQAQSDAKAKAASYHALVQLDHIPDPPEKAALAARGIHLQNYLPQQAWVARIDTQADKVSSLVGKGGVAWIGALLPADKVAPALAEDLANPTADKDTPVVPVIVQFHDDVSLADGRGVLAKFGARITNEASAINAVTAVMKPSDVAALSRQEEVLWLESPLPPLTATNSNTRARTNVDLVQNVAPYNLNGAGVNVLVYDVGRASHEDYNGRIVDQDGTSVADHSSHVAGTVLGNGSGAGTSVLNNRGMAPSAGLITYGYQDDGSNLFFYDNLGDIQADMQNGLNHSANIATASLGTNLASNGTSRINNGQSVGVFNCNREGDYAAGPQLLDQIVRGSLGRPLIMTWANGNERGDGRCGTQFNTTAPPATAKNPIQVGAAQQNNDSSAGFSGWGPTDDGRLKPIVSAPGVGVLSTIPNQFIDNTGRNCDGTGDDFCWPYDTMSGTSMATPAVAGIAALMVQQFHNSYGPTTDPLPATVKAILMNSAASPSGGNGPDFQTGYGRVDARAAVDTIRENRFVEGKVTSNGEVQRYHLNVTPGTATLQVSLAWDDAAGTLLAATELVNDLDLRLIAPDGATTWQPWVLNPASPNNAATRGNDTLNNQEQVTVPNPAAGWWTVEVRSTSLPTGPQTYGLAATHNPWSFNIVYPLTSAVADAGWFSGPGTFQIHLDISDGFRPSTNLVTNLADPNALKLFVGTKQIDTGNGVGEGSVIQRGPVGNQYWLIVRAPSQSGAGLYDFKVDFLGALTQTETNAVRYNNTPTPPKALSIVIDTSGSMASYAQMPAAKAAGRDFIQMTEIGDGVAETQFNTGASLVQALLNVSVAADRNAMAGNLAGLSPSGSTALGQGLQMGFNQISADSRTHAMVLLSDGMENTPPMYDDIKASIPTGVRLDTVALGPLADQALMARIANDHPGSTPWYVPTGPGSSKSSGDGSDKVESVATDVSVASRIENRLTDVYHFIDNYQRRYQRLFEAAGTLNSGGSTTLSVNLNESARFLYFTVNWADSSVNLNFVLRRPDSSIVPTGDPNVYRVDSAPGGMSKRYRIAAPAAGSWRIELSNPSGFATEFLATVEGQVDTDLTLFTPSLGECRPTTPNKVCLSFNNEKGNIKGGRFEFLRARLNDGKQVQLTDPNHTGVYCSEDLRFEPGMQSFKVDAMGVDGNGRFVRRIQRADFYCGPLDLPPILLVNDAPSLEQGGQFYPVRDMYVAALNAIGVQYNVWNTDEDGIPSGAALAQYQKVIWITGTRKSDPRHPPLPVEAEKAVRQFLDARQGNTFALSSQDYLSINGVTEFGKDVLGIEAFDNNTRGTTMRGLRASPLGHNFGSFAYAPPYTNLADIVRPIPDAAANTVDETGRVTGITHGYGQGCAAFFSFGLEGLPPAGFQGMLKRFVTWDCAPVALNTTATPQDITLHYGDVYSTTFQIQNPLVGGLRIELNNGPTHLWLVTDSTGGVPSLLAPFNVGDLPNPQAATNAAPAKTSAAATPLDPTRVVSRLCQVSAAGLADCFAGGVVTLDSLLDNDVAVVWNNTPLGDPDRVGDMLADFVDRGGTVLLGGEALKDAPAGLGGRWAAEKYSPLATAGTPKGAASLGGVADPGDPLFAGVAALVTANHLDAQPQGDAQLHAKWSDGEALLASRSFQPGVGPQVIAINASFENGQWAGNLPTLVRNALGALDMTWRRPGWFRPICSVASPPIDGKVGDVPPIVFDGSASCPDVQGGVDWQVALQMDSRFTPASALGGPNPPHYQGKLTLDTNAMGRPRVAIPLSLTVLPADETPTPTPTETPTPTDTPAPTDTPTPTPTLTETPAPTDTPTPTATPTATATPAPTNTPTVTPTPYSGGTHKVYLPLLMQGH